MKVWQPWVEETKNAIVRYARWVFATLILSLLILLNVGAILFVINQMRRLLSE